MWQMVTLSCFITAARADGVVSVDAFPQMITEVITDPCASTTDPGEGPRKVS